MVKVMRGRGWSPVMNADVLSKLVCSEKLGASNLLNVYRPLFFGFKNLTLKSYFIIVIRRMQSIQLDSGGCIWDVGIYVQRTLMRNIRSISLQ